MSGVRNMLFGTSGTPATVQDITPEAFAGLQQPVAQNLQNIIAQGGLPQFQGPTVAPITEGEQARLAQIRSMAETGTPEWSAARQAVGTQMAGAMSPAAGQTQLTPELMQALSGVAAGGGQFLSPGAQQQLQTFATGGAGPLLSPQMQQVMQQMAVSGQAAMDPQAQALMGSILSGQTMDPAQNPALQASIEMAQRPILEQFGDANLMQRAQFAQAGQQVTPGASSPFDVAQARLQTGLAGALGDVGTRLVSENLAQERARQMQALGLSAQLGEGAAGRQLQALGLGGQLSGQERAQVLQALGLTGDIGAQQQAQQLQALGLTGSIRGQELDREQTAFEAAQQRSLQAAGQAAGMARAELDAITTALQAEALPRMIEQQGIDRGMEMFNQQQASLMQALQQAGMLGQQQAVTLPGTEGTGGLLGPALTAAASAFGGPIGGALAGSVTSMFGGGGGNFSHPMG